MGKRANGEGTISPRRDKNGKITGWKAAVTVGIKPDGTPQRRWISGKTQGEVREQKQRLESELNGGMLSDTEGLTLAEFLDRWLEHKARDRKANTMRSYQDTVRLYLKKHLGRTRLEKLRPTHVEHLLSELLKSGKSPALAAYALRVLKMALRQAVIWGMLPRNVAEAVKAPKVTRQEMQVWTPEEAVRFLQYAQTHRLYTAFHLALMTGMRRGELLGLKWEDIDWEKRRLKVRRNLIEVKGGLSLEEPKTKASRRTIALAASTVMELRAHRERQHREQLHAGDAYQDHGMVFASEVGTPTYPRNFGRMFDDTVKRANVPKIRLHDLRHTAASLLIRKGVSPKVVSDQLGHADVAFTLHVYTHLYEDQLEAAALDLADLLPRSTP